MQCGGTGASRPADEEAQKVIDSVKAVVEEKIGQALVTYKAIEVATQMVAGMNYFVKVHIGEESYIHLRVYQTLPCHGSTVELSGIIKGKGKTDAVEYFEGFQI